MLHLLVLAVTFDIMFVTTVVFCLAMVPANSPGLSYGKPAITTNAPSNTVRDNSATAEPDGPLYCAMARLGLTLSYEHFLYNTAGVGNKVVVCWISDSIYN